jgi:hypothetical protein
MSLMLCARSCDQLFHVLVAPEFEGSVRDFYYPPPEPCLLDRLIGHDNTGTPVFTKIPSDQARVALADIPFPRLKELIGGDLPLEKGLMEGIAHSQLILNYLQTPPPLTVHFGTGMVSLGEFTFPLSRQLLAVYAFFLTECNQPSSTQEMASLFQRRQAIALWERRIDALRAGEHESYAWETMADTQDFSARLRPCISKINRAIEAALGRNRLAERYRIHTGRVYGVSVEEFQLVD